MTFSVFNLLVLTAIVAIVSAAIGQFGVEVGVMVLFLAVANAVIAIRFYRRYKTGEPELAWTVFSACVIYPLTIVLIHGVWS